MKTPLPYGWSPRRPARRQPHRNRPQVETLEARTLPAVNALGAPIPVSTTAAQNPDVAADAAGNFVVVWQQPGQAGFDIVARRFNADGTPAGAEFTVNTTTAADQTLPSVAVTPAGDFVVAWEGQSAADAADIFARVFAADGTAAADEFRVNTTLAGAQSAPSVAIDSAGDFVIAFVSAAPGEASPQSLLAQRFAAGGTAVGGEILVRTAAAGATGSGLDNAAVGSDADGNFVIAFDEFSDATDRDVFAQRFAANGLPRDNAPVLININTTSTQENPDVAVAADGAYVIAWQSLGQDGSQLGIVTRVFNATGRAFNGEVLVNATTPGDQENPSVAIDSREAFLVAWEGPDLQSPGGQGTFVRQFSPTQTPIGGEVRVSTVVSNNTQANPAVILNAAGDSAVVVYDDIAAVGGTSAVLGQRFAVTTPVGGVARFLFPTVPTAVGANTPFIYDLRAVDSLGFPIATFNGTVTLTSSDPNVILPATATLTNGEGSFTATLSTLGNQSLTATDTVDLALFGTTDVTVTQAVPQVLTGFRVDAPATAQAGTPVTVTVTAVDQDGNPFAAYAGTVTFTSSDAAAVLPPNAQLTNGAGTFTVTFNTPGGQTITATDTANAALTGSDGVVVSSVTGVATRFQVTAPVTVPSGTPFIVTVTAQDDQGNTITDYAGTVTLTSSDPAAVLPANATLSNGVGSFMVTLNTSGAQTVTASDTANTALLGTANVNVTPLTLTGFRVEAPANATTGMPVMVTVTAVDANGNTFTNYAGTVAITSSDPAATLPANATLTNGVGSFTITFNTAGTQTVTATDTVNNTLTGSDTVTVAAPPVIATRFLVEAPATATVGTAVTITVTAQDAQGNTATGYTGTVAITSSDPAATLPANATLTNGVGTFTITFNTAGTQTVTATDTVTASIMGSDTVTVNPVVGVATQFLVTAPANAVLGTPVTFTVTAQDAQGNTVPGYTGTVAITSNDPAATLPANATLTNGVGTFTITFNTAGSRTVTATDTVNNTLTGSDTVTVTAAATRFLVEAPATATAGVPFTITVTAQDAQGNTIPGYTGTVAITGGGVGAVLPANAMLTNGVGTFTVTLNTAGTQTLTATDTVTSTITGSDTVTVNPSAVTRLLVNAPATATAGVPFTVTVTAQDAQGNTVPGYTGTVAITGGGAGAVLPANATLTNGVGTFTVTLNATGTQTITATDTANSTITGSDTVTVNAAVTTRLLVNAPATATAGVPFTVTVTAQDAQGNTVPGYTGTVRITGGGAGAVLPANATLTNGVGTFTVTLNATGTQTITATDTVTSTITGSDTVTVNAATPTNVVTATTLLASTTTPAFGQLVTFQAFVGAANGSTATGAVTFRSSTGQVLGTANLVNGVATLTTAGLTSGTQAVFATYAGGTGFLPSTSNAVTLTVGQPPPTFTDPFSALIYNAYGAVLQRSASTAEIAAGTQLLAQGLSFDQFVRGLTSSPEYTTVVVQNLYQQYLGRSADPSGLASGTNFINAGGRPEDFAVFMVASPEFFQAAGGTTSGYMSALFKWPSAAPSTVTRRAASPWRSTTV